ncbi:MAG TPA: hypothetical protein VFG23_02870 [Polyangia bacterium]|nr:hypothetical protein [Polyangia bacterium]
MANKTKRPQDPAKNLEVVAQFISDDVQYIVQASMVRMYALGKFSEDKEHKFFRCHPWNGLHAAALGALEERCVVHMSEVLKAQPLSLLSVKGLAQKATIRLHRIAISHPLDYKWSEAAMAPFKKANRDYKDVRAALAWNMQRDINDALRPTGKRLYNETIPVTWEMALMLENIFRACLRPEELSFVPATKEIFDALGVFRDKKFVAFLETMPDGQRAPKPVK